MSIRARGATAVALAAWLTLGLASLASAHVVKQVGPYSVAVGWLREPAYVGQENAVQMVIHDARGTPVADLSPDALTVVVSTAGKDSDPLALVSGYDQDTGIGTPGDYEAAIIPTAVGDYTFHVTGKIHATSIDETVTSSQSTFDAVVQPTGIQFPDQLPAMGDVATRIARVDSRAQGAKASADAASGTATIALVVGASIGGLGLVLGAAGLILAWRTRRRVRAEMRRG